MTELNKRVIEGMAPVTLTECVYLGDGTNKTLKDKIQELENSSSSSGANTTTGTTEHYKGLFSNYGNDYLSTTLESGIYLVKSDNLPNYLNPPINNDFVLIHQKLFTNFNWAIQIAYDYVNPNRMYIRRCLCGSPHKDGRQGKWRYIGEDYQITKLTDMKMLSLGDSIYAKWAGDPSDCTSQTPSLEVMHPSDSCSGVGIQPEIAKRTGIDMYTLARGGARYARTPAFVQWDNYSFYQLASKLDFSPYDMLLIGYGTNDCGNNLPIGDINSTNVEETCGAINAGLTKIYESNPNILIFATLPPVRMDLDGRAVKTFEENYARQKPYNDAIKAVYEKWNIPVFDTWNDGGINKYNYSKYMNVDCIHYNDYSLWGGRVAEWIKRMI